MEVLVCYVTPVVKLHYLNYVVVEVPPAILNKLPGKFEKGNFNQRLIIRLDGKEEWQCGMLAMGEGSGCITIQSKRLKAIGKQIDDDVQVELFKDESEFGVPVAEEIIELWAQDPETERRFRALVPSMQRYILNHIDTAKTSEKRIERTVLLFGNLLRAVEGKETFRELLGKG